MRKSFVTTLALCGMVAYLHAQGTFIIDSGANFGNGSGPAATTGGLVWLAFGGLDNTQDINLGALWGMSASSVNNVLNLDPDNLNSLPNPNWLANQATGSGDITSYGGGAIFDPNGNSYVVPGAAAGTTIFLVLEGWTGNATNFAAADAFGSTALVGDTAPFAITLAANTSPLQPDTRGMSALVLIPADFPEPSTLALSSLGAAALMLVRRRK